VICVTTIKGIAIPQLSWDQLDIEHKSAIQLELLRIVVSCQVNNLQKWLDRISGAVHDTCTSVIYALGLTKNLVRTANHEALGFMAHGTDTYYCS
jgi:hypothetical protein